MKYELATTEEVAKIKQPFESPNQIYIKHDNKFWILKFRFGRDEEKRDYLGYILGKNFANIAEVRLLKDSDLATLREIVHFDKTFTTENVYLVRVASTYKIEEFPAKTIEQAVATELIYSTLVRRRDTHSDNREYNTQGIPIFFDFNIAFLGEENIANIQTFFGQMNDHGRAGRWRVRSLPNSMTFFTRCLNHKGIFGGYHYVNDMDKFNNELELASNNIKNKMPNNWKTLIKEVGYSKEISEKIINFLEINFINLKKDLIIMKNIIFSSEL